MAENEEYYEPDIISVTMFMLPLQNIMRLTRTLLTATMR